MKLPTERLPRRVFSAEQVRALDRAAIEGHGVTGYELMCRAGAAAFALLRERWPEARRLAIVCGGGNNGGDGLVVARLARAAGLTARVLLLGVRERLKGEAAQAAADLEAAGGTIEAFASAGLASADVIVDALLGTGLARPVSAEFAAAIEAMNADARPVLALDVPSGLDANSGLPADIAVRAAATISFVGLKQGLFLGAAPDHCGELAFAGLGLPESLGEALAPALQRLGYDDLGAALPPRPRSAHKGSCGKLLLVGGGPGMPGAIRLAAEAALRVGAGLVYVGTHPDNVGAVLAGRPEIICRATRSVEDLSDLLTAVDAVVLGPGLGRSAWAYTLWDAVLGCPCPLVLDADGLNLLAVESRARGAWVLTPHPAEAARLAGLPSAADVQRDRAAVAAALAQRFGAQVVLKGANTLVAAPDSTPLRVCDRGNPGMASGGMGDVLAGVLGGLVAQTRDLPRSVGAGVLLHALAGDRAAATGERGLLASDLFPELRVWANPSY